MSSFTEDLVVKVTTRRVRGRTLFELVQGFEYRVGDYLEPSEIIVIPIGFDTDFMSIPAFLRPFMDTNRGAKAAIVHDYLLRSGRDYREADKIFLEGMKVLGMGTFERTAIYWAVSLSNRLKDLIGREITG